MKKKQKEISIKSLIKNFSIETTPSVYIKYGNFTKFLNHKNNVYVTFLPDEKYQRVRVRKLMENLERDGLDKNKLKKTIKNLKNANKVIEFYVDKNLRENTSFLNNKKRLVINSDFFLQPQEVTFRAFSESLKLIGEKYYSVRGKKLEKIIREVENNRLNRATLGGCIIEKVNQSIIISKEP